MTLTDTGPLVALIDSDEHSHHQCRDALERISFPLVTTWPAFTEAMHLVRRRGGWLAQKALWEMTRQGMLRIETIDQQAVLRCAELMERYRDHPIDLADASLVAIAEERGISSVFTLDSHFRSYRLRGGRTLAVIPS